MTTILLAALCGLCLMILIGVPPMSDETTTEAPETTADPVLNQPTLADLQAQISAIGTTLSQHHDLFVALDNTIKELAGRCERCTGGSHSAGPDFSNLPSIISDISDRLKALETHLTNTTAFSVTG